MTAALRRSRRFLPFETMKRLYKAFRVLCAYSKELEMASQREWKTQMSIAFYLPKSCSYDASGWYPILRIPQNFPIISLVFLGVSKLMPPEYLQSFFTIRKCDKNDLRDFGFRVQQQNVSTSLNIMASAFFQSCNTCNSHLEQFAIRSSSVWGSCDFKKKTFIQIEIIFNCYLYFMYIFRSFLHNVSL